MHAHVILVLVLVVLLLLWRMHNTAALLPSPPTDMCVLFNYQVLSHYVFMFNFFWFRLYIFFQGGTLTTFY